MTKVTREEMKKEGIFRMKMLNLLSGVVDTFEKDDKLFKTEGQRGILYDLDDAEIKMVKEVEEENEGLVYHVIKTFTEFGTLLNMLWVSKYKDEWEMDRTDIDDGLTFAYVKNLDAEYCSEFGSIGIRPLIGGVVRNG